MNRLLDLLMDSSNAPNSGQLLFELVARITLLLALATVVVRLLHRAPAALRHLVWTSAVVGTLVLPALALTLPSTRIPVWSVTNRPEATSPTRTPVPIRSSSIVPPPPMETSPRQVVVNRLLRDPENVRSVELRTPESQAKGEGSWALVLSAIWALGAAMVWLPMVRARLRLQQLEQRAQPLDDTNWQARLAPLCAWLGLSRSVVLLQSAEETAPMTWGIVRPRILLPAGAGTWPEERLRAVLLHELAHVKRCDCLTQVVSRLACAVYWFHPLVWLASRGLMVERERACDDVVLRFGTRPSDYASHLVAVARSLRIAPALLHAAVPMARASQIEQRVRAVLDARSRHDALTRSARRLAIAASFVIISLLSTGRLVARVEQTPSAVANQPTMRVTGRVLDPSGKPVAGAQVAILGRSRLTTITPRSDAQHRTLGHSQTGPDGRFQLDVPRTTSLTYYDVHAIASAPGFGIGWAELNRDAATPSTDVSLRPARLVEGQLVGPDGAPAASCRLELTGMGIPREEVGGYDGFNFWKSTPAGLERLWPPSVTTDARGRFRIDGIGQGVDATLHIDDPRFARQSFRIPGDTAPDHPFVQKLSPPMKLSGRVTAADTGEPLRDTLVSIGTSEFGGSSEYRTDKDGRYEARPAQGTYLHVTAYPNVGTPYLVFERNFREKTPIKEKVVDLRVPRGVLVKGRVIERGSDRPVSGASISYENGKGNVVEKEGTIPGWMSAVTTNADGTYAIALPPGKGTLLIYGPTTDYVYEVRGSREMVEGKHGGQRYYAHRFKPYEVQAGQNAEPVDVYLNRGVTVRGRVLGRDMKPVARAEIITTLSISPFHTFWRGDFTIPVRDGQFELHGVPPDGGVSCRFLDAEHGWGANWVIWGNMAEEPIEVVLTPAADVTLRLVDENGKPFEGGVASLHILASDGPGTNFGGTSLMPHEEVQLQADEEIYANVDRRNYWQPPRSDANGRLTLTKLIRGATYRIYEYRPDQGKEAFRWRDFQAPSGKPLDLGEIRVKRGKE